MKKTALILLILFPFFSHATHERAGEITYTCLGGLTYSITITTYTKGSSNAADRCSLMINFGDDTAHYTVCRANYEPGDPTSDPWTANCGGNGNPCSTHHMGEWSTACGVNLQSIDVKKNVYTITHTYPGPGAYIISMTDPNRNNGIINIPGNQVKTPFSIQDTLIINPFIGCNSSPVLNYCPIDRACAGKLFIHNPGAVDPDNDSLSYKLGVCYEDANLPISGYWLPSGVSVNALTGDFIWNVPPFPQNDPDCDEWNFAIDIEQWRKIGDGSYALAGTVRRDMQVTVCDCANDPPVISAHDTCIEANTSLTLTVTATDPDGHNITLFTAAGNPFTLTPAATFSVTGLNTPVATGTFSWKPDCKEVRSSPYTVTLKTTDDGLPDSPPMPLSAFASFNITVIAPAPKNLSASPHCSEMNLKWDAALCSQTTGNVFKGYKIYRAIGCDSNVPGYCQTSVPAAWGYSLIATVGKSITSYTDNNNGNGLTHGIIYAYRVVAYYSDGAESYASAPACNELRRDVPIMTNVSVISTGANGSMFIKWLKPLTDTALGGIDTLNGPPFTINLYRCAGNCTPSALIASFTNNSFAALDTTYTDTPLGTSASGYTYRVDFHYGTTTNPCQAQKASSVFLSCNPSDNQIQITWNEQVPWLNSQYDVFRKNHFTGNWDSIATTTTLQTFTDTGLANDTVYCYKVRSTGAYADPSLPSPLINWSQELCCAAIDKTPPCPPALAIDSSCILQQNLLTWTNPNNSCSNDAIYYIIYYTPVQNGEYSVLDTIHTISITSFLHDSLNSIAGCYAVTAVDSFGNQSAFSNVVCVDNCPYYELPNVFTPNADGSNDYFTPLHPYKYVKDIDIRIYNRWGTEVFHTTDAEIMWNGKSSQTNKLCSDGVYYYICIVNDIRLEGIVPRALKGNVTILSHE
ncbi:MAG: gliding motility-associated C-terminal domain-containing protein [Bacteroidetes bacterium]|nr:gliding motility-associated C-terminal domain-containing protein [Bacteroidota bacterium]